ncbi:helix-turn-helix domain-containing protein [Sphaerisporangium dianthi]|uniref:Helix-turn-helix domain-containing protein n=1 Tax=Sphaerisporangium dianthi TaxID=1436120 RepID=A0ABV9CCH5_9ACTN
MTGEHLRGGTPADEVLPPPGTGPTALRMVLGGRLRDLREAKGITRDEAGYAIRGSASKIGRLELGRSPFKARDVSDLLTLYGVTGDAERRALLSLAAQANAHGWWHKYGDVLPGWSEAYVGLEEAATVIRTYDVQIVPALLQTEDYARALIQVCHDEAPPFEVDRRLGLLMGRQRIIAREGGPRLWCVVDEAAVYRPFGGWEVQRAQLDHLIEVAAMPNVTLQVLPFEAGGHAATCGPFSILRFAEPALPDIVYLEQLTGALYLDKRADLDDYAGVLDRLSILAMPASETPRMLAAIRDRI